MLETAIILAGGYGTRLQTVVKELPKPMAPVNGLPFLNYHLVYLKHFGIKHVVLSVGYLAEKISSYYQSEFKGLKLTYVTESEPMGTGGGIRLAMENIPDQTVLVLNGDSFFEIDLHAYYDLHVKSASQTSLALRALEDCARYGSIETNKQHRIISFKEKTGVTAPGKINGGVYLINKAEYLENTPAKKNFSIEKEYFETQLNTLRINGFEFNGYFIDIGIPEDYQKAQHDFKEFKYH